MAAHCRALGWHHGNFDGISLLRISNSQALVASYYNWNVRVDYRYATILGALNLLHHSIMWRALINAAVFGFLSWWYFYLKPNVAQYFRELEDRHEL
jgi:hypothetical protein